MTVRIAQENPMTMDEVEPTCDICGGPEDHEVGLIEYDWNGETGNHRSCERDPKIHART